MLYSESDEKVYSDSAGLCPYADGGVQLCGAEPLRSHRGNDILHFQDKRPDRAPMTQWHGGFTYKLDLPLGFSLQPSLVYHAKGTRLKEQMFDIRMSYLELPVSFQWGPDLLIFRPFLDITPYIGYALGNQLAASGMDTARNSWNGLNRFEYGLGLGIGLELWRFQVIGRYNWNFGPLSNADAAMSDGFVPFISNAFSSNNFGGFTLSLAILFGGGK